METDGVHDVDEKLSNKQKVVFVLPNLVTGGAQRAMVNIAQSLDKSRFDVLLIVINSFDRKYSATNLDVNLVSNYSEQSLRTLNLGCNGIKWSILKIRRALKSEAPDIVFTSLSYVNLYLGMLRFILPRSFVLIARETNILSVKHRGHRHESLLNALFRIAYQRMDFLICQSKDMQEDLLKNFDVPAPATHVINNPVDASEIWRKSKEDLGENLMDSAAVNLISVGHLTYQKGHDIAIRAMGLVANDKMVYHIVGQGPRLAYLKSLVKELSLDGRVVFHGFQSNPFMFIKRASVFVFPSRFEGFPNALIEAGACGIPMLVNDCKGGIREIVNSRNGLLFDGSPEDMVTKLNQILLSEFDPQTIRDDISEKFDMDVIGEKYENYFLSRRVAHS